MISLRRCSVYTHNEKNTQPLKNSEILTFAATLMYRQNIIFTEVNQRQILYNTNYMWNLKIYTKESIYKQKQNHRHRKQTFGEIGGQEQIRSIRLIDTTIQIIGKQ